MPPLAPDSQGRRSAQRRREDLPTIRPDVAREGKANIRRCKKARRFPVGLLLRSHLSSKILIACAAGPVASSKQESPE